MAFIKLSTMAFGAAVWDTREEFGLASVGIRLHLVGTEIQ
jgi:hypothetical protein